jgi:hypothetical protein
MFVADFAAEKSRTMSERRRTSRFVIPEHSYGTFRLMQDVCVEKVHGDQIVTVGDAGLQAGEELILELPRALGTRSVVLVHVVSCNPIRGGESRRYRVMLRSSVPVEMPVVRRSSGASVTPPTPTLPALGVLVRRVPIRVRDVSTSGCQLESPDVLTEGAVGQLEIAIDGQVHKEPLRVCRSMRTTGGHWPWRCGAHFLALEVPAPASVRNVVARFEIVDELAGIRMR